MTSKLTREQLIKKAQEQIAFCRDTKITGEGRAHVDQCAALFEIALAAMVSEPVVFTDERNLHHIAMGRETSLIWGKQNHEAGDIPLYRHAQPEQELKPVRNPVLAYADSYRDMAKQGVQSVPIWSVITDLERNIAPLYRHAQQPVVPDENTLRIQGIEALEEFLTATTPEPEMVGGIKLAMTCCRALKAIIKNNGWADFNGGKPEKVKAETIISALREPHSDACRAAMLNGGKS